MNYSPDGSLSKHEEAMEIAQQGLKPCRKCRQAPVQKVDYVPIARRVHALHFYSISCPYGCRRIGLEFMSNHEFLGALKKLIEHWNGK